MSVIESDIRSFDLFFTTYKERFIGFANSYTRDEIMAEDIVMESFIYYWENRAILQNEDNIPAYVLKVIKNKCLNYLRNQAIHLRVEDTIRSHQERILNANLMSLEACDPQELFCSEVENIVKETLNNLPKLTREIFIKSRFAHKSYKEIAEEFHMTEKSVEFHISKALKILRIALKDYLPSILFWLLFGS